MTVKILDLYSDNDFDPQQIIADGYSGVVFKGGQGQLSDVPRYHRDWRDMAHAVGLDVGWYWLVDSRYSPESQKAAIKATFPHGCDELGLWLDCEKPRLDMSDAEYNQTPYHGYKTVESVARGVLPRGIYTGPGAFALIFSGCPQATLDWFAQTLLLWTAQYPWVYVPGVSKPTLYGSWKSWAFWQYREGPDVNQFGGTDAEYMQLFGDLQPVEPEAYVVQRSVADYDLCYTQDTGELLLLNAVEAAGSNRWDAACMNAGAGFDYTDADHAIPRIAGFEQINGIPYARRMITLGAINPNLDANQLAPWCVLGFDFDDVYFIVTIGMEGVSGMTQVQAAEYVKSLGVTDAYLMDSGHSAQLEEKGRMLYWPYGEKVPQHIGLRRKTTNGGSVKGVAKANTNIKAMTAGQTPTFTALGVGEYAYGSLVGSVTTGDLTGFDHYYTLSGARMALGCTCKAYAGNLILTNVTEPTATPDPLPADDDDFDMSITLTDSAGQVFTPRSIDAQGRIHFSDD